MSIRKATWVLTDTRNLFFHTFTCSSCGRVESATQYFDDDGHFDFKETAEELIKDYPYCHCGAKMQVDPTISQKKKQMKITHELHIKAKFSDNIREKEFWAVDEKPITDIQIIKALAKERANR